MSDHEEPDHRTGAALIAALQASPHRDIDIEPERYRPYGPENKPTGDPAEIPADRLLSVVNALLWEWDYEHPQNGIFGPGEATVRAMIDGLNKRPDAASETVQAAIAECWFFLEQPWA